ncbi:amino acid permease [Catellatospora sp. TT07R-123]|uniref:amino acid permease n=1 Tax=Catellatospora sp. TT07R-123 TaxID=2733863 RepID=UPI001FD61813|nr:amino acid permease [Catellatospora sp. TT07R-123]
MSNSIFRTKSVEQSIAETDEPGHRLKKELTVFDLTVFGIGVIIGTGIFVLTGKQAAINAGPAIVISFILAAIVCGLAALCYAEFASTVPVAGSAYTFGYATLGEFIAWIIGWDLALELGLGAAVVARGWSSYLHSLLNLPDWLAGDKAIPDFGAIFIVAVCAALGVVGAKISGRVTAVLVAIKIAVVLFVIALGAFFIKAANYSPYIPPAVPAKVEEGGATPLIQLLLGITPQHYGLWGILAASSIVFFAYIGFDIVATTAEETKNPQRDLPRGIIGSLVICTILYAAVSFVITGMANYKQLDTGAPLALAFELVGQDWAAKLISLGAICGITTVVLVLMLGQSRVLFAMSRDRLLPEKLAAVHPRYGTPWIITIVTSVIIAILAAFLDLTKLSELTSIGTLFAFVVVSIGVVVLRRTRPDLHRSFRVPWVPFLPIVAVLACLWLMLNLPVDTWIRFVIWMLIGLALYFPYGRRHSRLARSSTPSYD